MSIVTVLYPRHDGARFDAAYYRDTHCAMVEDFWHPDAITLVEGVGTPGGGPAPFAMIAHFHFASTEAMGAALADPRTAQLVADVPNFTDIQAAMMIGKAPD